MKGTSHNVANLLVYMPNEKLIFWGDGYNPPEGNDPRDFVRTPEQMIDLYRTITMLNLDRENDRAGPRLRRQAVRQPQKGDRAHSAMICYGTAGGAPTGAPLLHGKITEIKMTNRIGRLRLEFVAAITLVSLHTGPAVELDPHAVASRPRTNWFGAIPRTRPRPIKPFFTAIPTSQDCTSTSTNSSQTASATRIIIPTIG